MSNRWGVVVVNQGVSLMTVVGGISLALRHVRTLQRLEWQGVHFIIPDEEERAKVQASLERDYQGNLPLDFSASDKNLSYENIIWLEASGIYIRDSLGAQVEAGQERIAPDFPISSPADLSSATDFLYSQIRKSIEMDGVIAYYIMRPLARLFTKVLLNTKVSPNQATLGALCCGISAAILAGLGGATYAIFAGLLYWFGGVIDCIDGELARLRLQSSKIGEWLDSMVDEFSTIALLTGLGIGLHRDGYGVHWQIAALIGAAIATLTLGRMYCYLHKNGLTIDTAHFPWFFANTEPDEASASSSSIIGTFLTFIGYFIRRDANLTIIAILLCANLRVIALCTMLGGFASITALLIVHYSILKFRSA